MAGNGRAFLNRLMGIFKREGVTNRREIRLPKEQNCWEGEKLFKTQEGLPLTGVRRLAGWQERRQRIWAQRKDAYKLGMEYMALWSVFSMKSESRPAMRKKGCAWPWTAGLWTKSLGSEVGLLYTGLPGCASPLNLKWNRSIQLCSFLPAISSCYKGSQERAGDWFDQDWSFTPHPTPHPHMWQQRETRT